MIAPLTSDGIAAAYLGACLAELAALKPGNVHAFGAGHRMDVQHFEAAAQASAPFIADADLRPGRRIRLAVEASLVASGSNTNLGIVLLCVPLAAAAQRSDADGLRQRLSLVLRELDTDDAAEAFVAIAAANPAGLGTVEEEDVAAAPTVTLRETMALAADRDRIANAYVTDYADIFELGLDALETAREQTVDPLLAITTLHMTLLSSFPDSHIARKHGVARAANVVSEARALAAAWKPVATQQTFDRLLAFDRSLKARGLNPGTTADLVVATLFADALQRGN